MEWGKNKLTIFIYEVKIVNLIKNYFPSSLILSIPYIIIKSKETV